jgi:uncharacterized protein
MKIPFYMLYVKAPLEALQEHAEKVKECSWAFQQAIECYASRHCHVFEEHRKELHRIENEADSIKRRFRNHLPKNYILPMEKFQLFRYVREQDSVVDSAYRTANWLSFRPESGIPTYVEKEFFLLVEAVISPIEELSVVVAEARVYFRNFSEKQRSKIKGIIYNLRQMEKNADKHEYAMVQQVFKNEKDPVNLYFLIKLSEFLGNIADHAENAADMMWAMVAK